MDRWLLFIKYAKEMVFYIFMSFFITIGLSANLGNYPFFSYQYKVRFSIILLILCI